MDSPLAIEGEEVFLQASIGIAVYPDNAVDPDTLVQQTETADDFGTGYSSLSYLKTFPVTTLKVDRAFVGELHNASGDTAIVDSVIALGHSLGLTVVAEGIEQPEHIATLTTLGCDYGQRLLHRPAGGYGGHPALA